MGHKPAGLTQLPGQGAQRMPKGSPGLSLSPGWTGRAELLTPGQVLHNPEGPLAWKTGQLDAKLLSAVFFPLQTVLVFCQLGEKQHLYFGTELWKISIV